MSSRAGPGILTEVGVVAAVPSLGGRREQQSLGGWRGSSSGQRYEVSSLGRGRGRGPVSVPSLTHGALPHPAGTVRAGPRSTWLSCVAMCRWCVSCCSAGPRRES